MTGSGTAGVDTAAPAAAGRDTAGVGTTGRDVTEDDTAGVDTNEVGATWRTPGADPTEVNPTEADVNGVDSTRDGTTGVGMTGQGSAEPRPVPAPESGAPGAAGARRLDRMTWTEVAALAAGSVLLVPVGSNEQHGPHLPFTVDTDIALALAERLAAARAWMVLAPPVHYGSSGEHAGFPGTLSIGQTATELLLTELGRSADAFAAVAFVSAHGGNAVPVRRAVARLRHEGRRAYFWEPAGDPADSHAGRDETSAMLVLRPEAVRLERAAAGVTRPLPSVLPQLRRGGLRAVTANGVLGDPGAASAATGRALLDAWAAALLSASEHWRPGE